MILECSDRKYNRNMKIIKFFLVLVLSICSAHAQQIIEEQEGEQQNYEPISYNALQINNKIGYNSTPNDIVNLYGTPASISDVYWEMRDVTVKYYHYNGAIFMIMDGTLESFELTSPHWFLSTGHMQLQVGQSINEINNFYPKAYLTREKGHLVITLGLGDTEYLLVKYNSSNIITCIEQRTF